MALASNFTTEFKRLFAEQAWTQYRLAKESGLSQSMIGSYLEGKRPTLDSLESIAKAFGVEPLSMLTGKTVSAPQSHALADCVAAVSAAALGKPALKEAPPAQDTTAALLAQLEPAERKMVEMQIRAVIERRRGKKSESESG